MSKIVTPVRPEVSLRICQGDIIKNVKYVEYNIEGTQLKVEESIYPYVIVLSQDCDLSQDYNNRSIISPHEEDPEKKLNHDKYLVSTIVAPLYNFEHLREGDHLLHMGLKMHRINSDMKGNLISNTMPRYHYFDFGENILGLVPSVVDFKHYFTVNVKYLEHLKLQGQYVCKISELYRENISHRFAHFLSRIGLPDVIQPTVNA